MQVESGMGVWGCGEWLCAGSGVGRACPLEQKAPPPGGGGGAALRSPPLLALTRFSTTRLASSQSPAGSTKPLCAWKAGGCPAGLTPTRATTGRGPAGTQSVWDGGGGGGTGHAGVNYTERREEGEASANTRSEGATVTNRKDRDQSPWLWRWYSTPKGAREPAPIGADRVGRGLSVATKPQVHRFPVFFHKQHAWAGEERRICIQEVPQPTSQPKPA